ncbi:MAG TPA: glycerol kinase GlpK [Bacilli bacterium]|nr:glycerol kinase GlpK [Bacilli bacterium]
MERYLLALDQGTTSSRAILYDKQGQVTAVGQHPFAQQYPQPGHVEHDAQEIWLTQKQAWQDALQSAALRPEQVAGIGITNQRETTVLWDKATGEPVGPAIVWQCRRTSDRCQELKAAGYEELIREKTGLVLDAYFSATKAEWMLDAVSGLRERAERGEILFGTIDTWLIWKLTSGRLHLTDVSNASRTLLFNIQTLEWDAELLRLFRIPRAMLPEVRSSSEVYGMTDPQVFGAEVPIAGIAGDQQAALFGQGCLQAGMAKNTYGTGCFLLLNTGEQPIRSQHGLLTTVAWKIGDRVTYALEGSVFIAGAAVQWLRDEMQLIREAQESEELALSVPDTNGVYFVPAFTGLGAPYWDQYARGTLWGLTRGTNRAHIVRAALEAIVYQSRDVLDAMKADSGLDIKRLLVDGGAVQNRFLMQFQADLLACETARPTNHETTARGVAFLAGLATGFWPSAEALGELLGETDSFSPRLPEEERENLYQGWRKAAMRSGGWLSAPDDRFGK